MNPNDSFRKLSSNSLIFAGIVTALFWLTTLPFDSFAGAEVSNHPLFIPGQALHALGAVLTALGVISIYLVVAGTSGWLALIGLILAFVGALAFLSDAMIALITFPVMAEYSPDLIETSGPMFTGTVMGFFIAFSVIQMLGYSLLGLAAFRSGLLPKTACTLFILGGIISNLPPIPGLHIVLVLGGILWSLGAIGIGLNLNRQTVVQS